VRLASNLTADVQPHVLDYAPAVQHFRPGKATIVPKEVSVFMVSICN
jgi:hypothetical protein